MIRYPARINSYALDLLGRTGEPIWRQLVPHREELDEAGLPEADPLCETEQSPADGIIHRYPDRVLFTVSTQCAVYCRHCMRKREVGSGTPGTAKLVGAGLAYIADTPAIKEVILSGGDPLMLGDDRLSYILARIRAIDHVELVRIHTRAPAMLPARITNDLVRVLSRFHPLYVNIQFNHPDELSSDAVEACSRLADAGIPLGAQSVLLAGVNDDSGVMTVLMRKLLAARVRPYYLHHPDPIKGTAHFRVPLERGLSILEALRGRVSGMGVPQYMIDLPGGGGKVPLLPQYLQDHTGRHLVVYNFEKKRYTYPL
ncbi:MAG: KamA family radical SAM protein [Desulfobacterales bacterium]|nr:KamA family radical SAM protein [Desulfobacterales bacterium]MBS3754783.1 KamA family radical SAM protein [Desulfobacterales bacterium]